MIPHWFLFEILLRSCILSLKLIFFFFFGWGWNKKVHTPFDAHIHNVFGITPSQGERHGESYWFFFWHNFPSIWKMKYFINIDSTRGDWYKVINFSRFRLNIFIVLFFIRKVYCNYLKILNNTQRIWGYGVKFFNVS